MGAKTAKGGMSRYLPCLLPVILLGGRKPINVPSSAMSGVHHAPTVWLERVAAAASTQKILYNPHGLLLARRAARPRWNYLLLVFLNRKDCLS